MNSIPRWISSASAAPSRVLSLGSVRIGALPSWLMLAPVLALGLAYRLWDLGQPFFGYHMWNEVYYTTIARNFGHFGLLAPYNYSWLGGSSLGPRYGPAPFVPWLVYLSSQVLGNAEWAARMPILVLGLLSLGALYLIARELYDTQVALAAAFAAAIMPGMVFFSRQVALDGPMTAFGLAAVWTLLVARRTGRIRWLLASAVLLGTAVFIKYTAVLFVPCVAWIWLTMLRGAAQRQKRSLRVLAGIYCLLAALPAVAWLALGQILAPAHNAQDPQSAYLNRSFEWNLAGWKVALLLSWTRFGEQVGRILWYPLALAAILVVTARRTRAFVRTHVTVILLVVPWFAQLIYPYSWAANDAYTYPTLYGIALLLGLAARGGLRFVQGLPGIPARQVYLAASLLTAVIAFSCLLDYQQVYHSWYTLDFASLQRPANAVAAGADPFVSAKLVRAVNVTHQPVLADLPATLYYAADEYWKGTATWWWWGLGEEAQLIADINSRGYVYVVFTYEPTIRISAALATSGYRRIGPAAWERIEEW